MNSESWKAWKIGEIGRIVTGKTPSTKIEKNFGNKYPFITPRDMLGQKRIYETERYLSDEGMTAVKSCLLPKNAICVSCIGSDMGKVVMTTTNCVTNQQLNSVICNESMFQPEFIYYALTNISEELKNVGHHSTAIPILNKSDFSNFQIAAPDLPTQRCIAEILSALDDKIELNRQTNATIEAIAQAIFKEWFVDFNCPGATGEMVDSELGPIPRGWRVGILSEVLSSIESGSRPKGGVGDLAEGIPSIGAENINGLGFYDFSKEKFVSEEFFAKLKSGIVKSEDVLLYKDGASLGRKTMFMDGFPHQICAINEHVFILRSNNLINQLFLYFWLDQSYMTENIKSLNSNSAQPGINQPAVRSLPILIPEKTISEKFEQIVKPLLSKLFNDCKESYSLSLLRDKLLPKLMSGEIQI